MADEQKTQLVVEHLRKDKTTAVAVRDAVSEQMGRDWYDPVHVDITGAPSQVAHFRHYKQQEQAALFEARESLFHRKIELDVELPNGGGHQRRVYLMTKSGVSAGVLGDDWMLISWMAPITASIRDANIGDTVDWERPRTLQVERLTVRARGAYDGTLLPKLTEVTYNLGGRAVFVKDESKFLKDEPSAEEAIETAPEVKPTKEYKAASDFGLHEIIQQADPKQWRTLHLPFKHTVLVEGPPGSGKTSIGLMRVPCLIYRQWEEMGLRPERDEPFHQASTMVVLVMNAEMINYLARSIRSVGVQGLPVKTMQRFCLQLCNDGGTLVGRRVNETDSLTRLKHHRLAFSAVWAGLCKSVERFWQSDGAEYLEWFSSRRLVPCSVLVRGLHAWKDRLLRAEEPTAKSPAPNLAEVIRSWQQQTALSDFDVPNPQRGEASRRDELQEVKDTIERFGKAVFDRARLFDSMSGTQAWDALLEASDLARSDEVVEEWRKQTRGEVQHIADGDLLLHARLAAHLTLLRGFEGSLAFGGGMPQLTHVVIDEAQDIAIDHIRLIKSLLHADGTLTLVGDLRQRVANFGFFGGWGELELGKCTNAIFKVNHRQSQHLGAFVSKLHACLFESEPDWRPSDRKGPKPRIRPKRGFSGLARVVADEIHFWRTQIPRATVGILYHGKRWNQASRFAAKIGEALGKDGLTEIFVASATQGGQMDQLDCAIIASVEFTKGLEFEAVVFIDRHKDWTGRIEEVSEVRRNGLYVAASRAKQGLSLILDDRCELLTNGLEQALFESVPVVHAERDAADGDDDFEDDQGAVTDDE